MRIKTIHFYFLRLFAALIFLLITSGSSAKLNYSRKDTALVQDYLQRTLELKRYNVPYYDSKLYYLNKSIDIAT